MLTDPNSDVDLRQAVEIRTDSDSGLNQRLIVEARLFPSPLQDSRCVLGPDAKIKRQQASVPPISGL